MDFLISCPCGHTLERHGVHDGCGRCACANNRVAALDALIEATKREPQSVVVELCTRIEADTAQAGWEAVASRRKRRTKTR